MPRNGFFSLQRHADPVDLALDDLVVVVGALRPAENDRAAVPFERLGQLVAEPRPAHVERDVAVSKLDRDTAGGGKLPVQNDQDRRAHRQESSWREQIIPQNEAIGVPINSYPVDARLQDRRRETDMPPLQGWFARLSCRASSCASRMPRGTNRGASAASSLLASPGTTTRWPRISPR